MTNISDRNKKSGTTFFQPLVGILIPLMLSGCLPSMEPQAGSHHAIPIPEINEEVVSSAVSLSQLATKLDGYDVVLVGESHTQLHHHLLQLDVIRALHKSNPDLIVGAEFFQRPFQAVLDQYIGGEITEEQFLRQTEYFDRWRFDYRLYKPVIDYLREHKIPLYALNLSREITSTVSEKGYEGLSEAQKAQLPKTIDREVPGYRERIEAVFAYHPDNSAERLERFLEVQLLWDEGMAARAASAISEHQGAQMIILAGAGHVAFGTGIATRLQRRIPDKKLATVLPLDTARYEEAMPADFVVSIEEKALPESGKMGVQLDTSSGNLIVQKVMPDSAAAAIDLPEGLVIQAVDAHVLASYTDLRIAMLDKIAGDVIQVKTLDKETGASKVYAMTLK